MFVTIVVNSILVIYIFDTNIFLEEAMYKIGEKIKEIRKKEHLTQVEFAKIFGLSHSHISKETLIK